MAISGCGDKGALTINASSITSTVSEEGKVLGDRGKIRHLHSNKLTIPCLCKCYYRKEKEKRH